MTPEVAVLVSTYQRPEHLERCLLSIALQRGVTGGMEVVVTDDGSTDGTHELVANFARTANFPVRLTTHAHTTFQLARCRNEGVAASTAPYLLFLDGDCILPPDHVCQHLRHRQPGLVLAGYCVNLDRATSDRVTAEAIRSAEFIRWGSWSEALKLWKLDWKSRYYYAIGHSLKPRLFGGNIGIARRDYELVNGYDENFEGWGCEDDDLRIRLRRAGKRIASILRWTRTYHLWHPPGETTPNAWREGKNVAYLRRPYRLTRCRNGLVKRGVEDLKCRVINAEHRPGFSTLLQADRGNFEGQDSPDVEILIGPNGSGFSGQADCNILVLLEGARAAVQQLSQAHVVVCDESKLAAGTRDLTQDHFRLEQFDEVLRKVA